MTITKTHFGTTQKGEEVVAFTLTNSQGNSVRVLNYGCIIQSIILKDKHGQMVDVVTGFDTIEDYDAAGGFVGALVGRCANRINDASFKLNDKAYSLVANEGNNHLHGGKEGFSKKIFSYELVDDSVVFRYLSVDGEENYPGNLQVEVMYKWNEQNELLCEYRTKADQDTVVNLTNHSYFNMNGIGNGHAFTQQLCIHADYMTPLNEKGLLTGEIVRVDKSCFDFREPTVMEEKFDEQEAQIKYASGYDHNYVLTSGDVQASLYGESTGIQMTLATNTPGLQLYSGNYVRERRGKYGVQYGKRIGVCLEPQQFPNSINFKHFPQPIQLKDKLYTMETKYSFQILE